MKRLAVFLLLGVALAVAGVWICFRAAVNGPLRLNQHAIEEVWLDADAFEPAEARRARWSRLQSGFGRLISSGRLPEEVKLEDPRTVFSYVFSHFPSRAIVYPTETYYYWSFPLGERRISGNVRLLDAAEGILHIGYFDPEDPKVLGSASFGAKDGVAVEPLSDHEFRVTADGRTVTFFLPQRALQAPRSLRLATGEKVVTGVLDESGLALALLYHPGQKAFYFVLNEDIPPADRFLPVGNSGPYEIGERSRFVFFHDPQLGRRLLVGVLAQNIRDNGYYDGPFDQVPPRLAIRAMLEASYPYVRLAGGIDEHGNFVNMPGQRVAISPYQAYESLTDLVAFLDEERKKGASGPALWARLTYEAKRDFHKQDLNPPDTLPSVYGGEHRIFHSQGWPPNHWGNNSRAWPLTHQRKLSSQWPANHNAGTSLGGPASPAPSLVEGHKADVSKQAVRALRRPAGSS